MTTFRYTAIDGRGQSVCGELAAPCADEALRRLKKYGMFHSVISEQEAAPSVAALSTGQAAQLAEHVSDLARSGLPLPAGLRAMAEELPRGQVSRTMRVIAQQLEAGISLEEAVQSHGERLPAPLREMLAAGQRSGRLAVVLEQFVELERARADLRHRLWGVLAYPTLLLLMLVGLHLFSVTFVVPNFKALYAEYGLVVSGLTELVLAFFAPAMAGHDVVAAVLLVLLFYLCTTGRPASAQLVLYGIPMVGSLWRWSRLAEFSRLMAIMLDQQMPLPLALRCTAAGLSDPELAAACRTAADRVEAGAGFAQSLDGLRAFPATILPLVSWGQFASHPAEAMRAATDLFEDRARAQVNLLQSFFSPLLFMVIVGAIIVVAAGLMSPLIELISSLSGSWAAGGGAGPVKAAPPFVFGAVSPVLFGLAILLAINHLLARPGEDRVRDLVRRALTILGWTLIAIGVFGGTLMVAGVASLPVAMIVVPMLMVRQYRANRRALLSNLAAAAERFMPLGPVLEAFAAEGRWWLSARARRMANFLQGGMTLPEALERCPGLLSPDAAMTVRVGYQTGSLPQALREAAAREASTDTLWHALTARCMYLFFLTFFALHVLVFVMLRIVPQYKKIFDDFGTTLPSITMHMVSVSRMFAAYWWFFFLLSLPLWLLGVYAMLRYVGFTTWDPPLVRRLTRRFHTEAILRALAVVAERGLPMPEGIAAMARHYPAAWVRLRLYRVLMDVDAGQSWSQSLVARGMIGLGDQAVLDAAQRVGNLPWALREMAASNVRRLLHRLSLLVQLLFPPVVLAFGLVEAFFVVGLFMPLVALIRNLTGV